MRRLLAVVFALTSFWMVQAASAATCSVVCVNGDRTGEEQSSCTVASCQDRCFAYCAGARGGCRDWNCGAGGATSPTGDNCAVNYAAGGDTQRTAILTVVTATHVPASSFSCQTTAFSSDRCAPAGSCSTAGQNCCVPPPPPANCADTAIASRVSGHPSAGDVTRIETDHGGAAHTSWTCRTPADDAERADRCVIGGCPGTTTNVCCLPPTAARSGPAACVTQSLAAHGATEADVARIEAAAPVSSRNNWTCRTATDAERATGATQRCIRSGCRGSSYCCAPAVPPPPCGEAAIAAFEGNDSQRAAFRTQLENTASSISAPLNTWTCQRICGTLPEGSSNRCVINGCSGGAAIKCCAPSTGIPTGQTCAAGEGGTGSKVGRGVSQIGFDTSCWSDGNCSLDDIVRAGTAFANYLFGISGAIFLLIFVYGGFRYLIAGGDSGEVGKSKDMIRNAAIGIVLMFGAATLIRWIQNTVSNPPSATVSQCETTYGPQGYVCQYIPDEDLPRATTDLGCIRNLCRLPEQNRNILCCPVTGAGIPDSGGGAASTPCHSDADCTGGATCAGVTAGAAGTCTTPGPAGGTTGALGRCAVTCTGAACRTGDAARTGCESGGGTFDGSTCTFQLSQATCTSIDNGTASGYEDRADRSISATFTP